MNITLIELEFLKLTEQFNFAGLILITAQEKAIEERLKNMEMPKVLVNRILPYYTGDSVLIDNFQAGYQATMHLIELGHRHIGFIKGPGVSSASTNKALESLFTNPKNEKNKKT